VPPQNSNVKRVFLAYPPNGDELSEQEKEAAADVMAEDMQDALLTDEEKAEIGFVRTHATE
jgi:hypothetical protein